MPLRTRLGDVMSVERRENHGRALLHASALRVQVVSGGCWAGTPLVALWILTMRVGMREIISVVIEAKLAVLAASPTVFTFM